MVRVIVVPVVALVADSVNDTVGARSLMVLVAVALLVMDPLLSVALTYTVKVAVFALPVLAYAWLSVVAVSASVSTVPSPHDTLSPVTLMLLAPELALIVRLIDAPVVAVVVDSVKLTLFTAPTTLDEVADLVVEPELSVAFT